MCQWFANCEAEAVTTVAHPAFPEGVPCCSRCAHFAVHGEFPKAERPTVVVGWDGRSRPMYRYEDEMHLPDSQRSIVAREEGA